MEPVRRTQSIERTVRFPSSSSSSSSSASLRIVPRGFESTSHPIFQQYRLPVYRPTYNTSTSRNQVREDQPSVRTLILSCQDVPTSFPRYSDNKTQSVVRNTRPSCSICLRPIVRPVTVVSPSNCVHSYCFGCLFRWFQQRTVCPLCNTHAASFITFIAHTTEDEDQEQPKIPRIIPKLNSLDAYEESQKQIDGQNDPGGGNDKQDDEIQLWKFISPNNTSERPSSSDAPSVTHSRQSDSNIINLTDESDYTSNYNSSSSSSRKRKFEKVVEEDQNDGCDGDEQDPSLSYALRIHKQRFPCI